MEVVDILINASNTGLDYSVRLQTDSVEQNNDLLINGQRILYYCEIFIAGTGPTNHTAGMLRE
jgi:hypothetical protein